MKKIIEKYFTYKNHFIWKSQIKNTIPAINELNEYKNKKILIIVPHADDELIGCFKLMESNYTTLFYCSFLGSNNTYENKLTREKEFVEFCNVQKFNYHIVKDNMIVELAEAISNVKPDTVFLPSLIDWHPEHRTVNRILFDTVKKTYKFKYVGWYTITVPIVHKYINSISKMNKNDFEKKWNLFKGIYQSQQMLQKNRFKLYEKNTSYYAIERFCIFKTDEWIRLYLNFNEKEYNFFNLKKNINNPAILYHESEKLYSQYFINKDFK